MTDGKSSGNSKQASDSTPRPGAQATPRFAAEPEAFYTPDALLIGCSALIRKLVVVPGPAELEELKVGDEVKLAPGGPDWIWAQVTAVEPVAAAAEDPYPGTTTRVYHAIVTHNPAIESTIRLGSRIRITGRRIFAIRRHDGP